MNSICLSYWLNTVCLVYAKTTSLEEKQGIRFFEFKFRIKTFYSDLFFTNNEIYNFYSYRKLPHHEKIRKPNVK